jgi:hypothetical protein
MDPRAIASALWALMIHTPAGPRKSSHALTLSEARLFRSGPSRLLLRNTIPLVTQCLLV